MQKRLVKWISHRPIWSVDAQIRFAIAVVFAVVPFPSFAEANLAKDTFLWGGEQLADLRSQIADRVRATYGPVIAAFPNLATCEDASSEVSEGKKLTTADLLAMPDLETIEVCLFYSFEKMTTEEIIGSMTALGFRETEHLPTGSGSVLNSFWAKSVGPVAYRSGFRSLLYRGILLVVRIDSVSGVRSVRLEPISKVQF